MTNGKTIFNIYDKQKLEKHYYKCFCIKNGQRPWIGKYKRTVNGLYKLVYIIINKANYNK